MRFKGGHHSFEQRCAYQSKTGTLRTGMIAEAIERIDSYTAKANALLEKSNQITDATRHADSPALDKAAAQLDRIHAQFDSWQSKARLLASISEVRAELDKREAKS